MRAIIIDTPGDASVLQIGEAPAPAIRPGAIRIEIHAAGLNRADLLQRKGHYPPPPGASPLLGLECAGVVAERGEGVGDFAVGQRVMALLPGGGYAEEVVVDAGSVMPLPDGLSFVEGAGLPETLLTVYSNVFELGALPDGGTVLVHGGGSGIGTTTIDLVKRAGGRVFATAGSAEKCARCREIGADAAFDYREEDWSAGVKDATGGEGVDVVLDSIGAPYLEGNLAALKTGGRLVLIGLMGGAKTEVNLGVLLARRLQVIGSTLRTRSDAEKAALVRAFLGRFGDALAAGEIRPIVHRALPLAEAAEAHRILEASTHFGKVVLEVRPGH